MNILWQSKSAVVYESFNRRLIDADANGGNAYDLQAAFAIAEKYSIKADIAAVRKPGESIWSYMFRVSCHQSKADLLIMEPYLVVFGRRRKAQKTISVIHHIDEKIRKSGWFHRYFFNRLLLRLKQVDRVITVSTFWKTYLEKKGCKNVEVIYNSFDTSMYTGLKKDENTFREKFNIPKGKKIIYIGNATREKGVYEVYEALKNSDYHLVMTGPSNRASDLPVQYVHLNRNDYLQLLACSSLVIAFSKMDEGWNRIAHESLLSRTPVIGSGAGGMSELLVKAGQPIISDPNLLLEAVEKVLALREYYSDAGFNYVKQFDMNYFKNEWQNSIKKITGV